MKEGSQIRDKTVRNEASREEREDRMQEAEHTGKKNKQKRLG